VSYSQSMRLEWDWYTGHKKEEDCLRLWYPVYRGASSIKLFCLTHNN